MSIVTEAFEKAHGSFRHETKTTSIIQEAFEKTASPSRNQEHAKRRAKRQLPFTFNRYAWILVVCALLLFGGSVFYILYQRALDSASIIPAAISVAPIEEAVTDEYRQSADAKITDDAEIAEENIESPFPISPEPEASIVVLAEVKELIALDDIVYTPERPLAIINGSLCGEGDNIGKFKISKIGKNFIKITSEGQEFIIELKR